MGVSEKYSIYFKFLIHMNVYPSNAYSKTLIHVLRIAPVKVVQMYDGGMWDTTSVKRGQKHSIVSKSVSKCGGQGRNNSSFALPTEGRLSCSSRNVPHTSNCLFKIVFKQAFQSSMACCFLFLFCLTSNLGHWPSNPGHRPSNRNRIDICRSGT